jgi:hypothetical protein
LKIRGKGGSSVFWRILLCVWAGGGRGSIVLEQILKGGILFLCLLYFYWQVFFSFHEGVPILYPLTPPTAPPTSCVHQWFCMKLHRNCFSEFALLLCTFVWTTF